MKNIAVMSLLTAGALNIRDNIADWIMPDHREEYCKAIQHKPIPKKTGNVLYDTINEINSYMVFKGLRFPASPAKQARKKGAKHNESTKIRSAVQLRNSRLKFSI